MGIECSLDRVINPIFKFPRRMKGMVAKRLGVPADKVKNTIIWGNHSPTQFPDLKSAIVELPTGQCSAHEAIKDEEWIRGDFIKVKNNYQ